MHENECVHLNHLLGNYTFDTFHGSKQSLVLLVLTIPSPLLGLWVQKNRGIVMTFINLHANNSSKKKLHANSFVS